MKTKHLLVAAALIGLVTGCANNQCAKPGAAGDSKACKKNQNGCASKDGCSANGCSSKNGCETKKKKSDQ